jgi:hypothetical protein
MTFGNAFGLSLYGATPETRAKASSASGMPEPIAGDLPGDSADAATEKIGTKSVEPEKTPPESETATDHAQPEATQKSLPVTLPGPDWPQIAPLDEAVRLEQNRKERIDKSALVLSEPRRIRDLGHLAFVASKPCLVCGKNRAHAHHLKFAQPTALGRKVSDEFTVPLCSLHHRELHQHGDERAWWAARSIDALQVAEELWKARKMSSIAGSSHQ